ncbi:uncharacterized protein PRCAT00003553001 [Priceomyces carsonii]|uniref:uncharacterized protein n=1 Tax=Priceomyces carsonii TaxID=28549 RepID=UPI002EDB0709|nr:unnamed protein product [Priceomyces carsonii]
MNINLEKLIEPGHEQGIPSLIRAPFQYIENIPGNNGNIRSKFLIAFNDLYYKIPHKALLAKIEDIISIFHNSSLLIDDIEDYSDYRRGEPAAHTKFGIPLTINCGNLMYFVALHRAQEDLTNMYIDLEGGKTEAEIDKLKYETLRLLIDEMLNLHHGQGLDIYWRDHLVEEDLPQVEQYLHMIKNKTGGLFRLSVKLLQQFSLAPNDLTIIRITNLLGIIYQIRDDYLNLIDDNYSHMKGVTGEDLIEGKLSLPILHCLQTTVNSPVHKLLYDLRTSEARKAQPDLIKAAISFMRTESQSLMYSHDLMKQYELRAKDMILSVSPTDGIQLTRILEWLCNI